MLREQRDALVEAPHEVEGARERQHELDAATRARLLGKPTDLRERLAQRLAGLGVGVGACRLLRETAQELDRRLGFLGPVPVVGQPVVDLLEAASVERLQRAGGGRVNAPAPGGEQALVGHLLDERVLEGVARLVAIPELVEELEALQLDQVCLEVDAVPDSSQQLRGEFTAEDGRGLQGSAWRRRAAGRCAPSARPRPCPARAWTRFRCPPGRTLASSSRKNGFPSPRRTTTSASSATWDGSSDAHELPAVAGGEPGQRELGRVRTAGPGWLVPRAIRGQQHHGLGAEAVGEARQELLGGLVHPVEVLDHEDEGAPARAAQAHLQEGLEGAGLDGLGGDVGQRLRACSAPRAGGAGRAHDRPDRAPPRRARRAPSSRVTSAASPSTMAQFARRMSSSGRYGVALA